MIRIYDSQQSGLLSTGNIELFRATRMSRERTCPAALTAKGLALLRPVSLGIFSDVARANRPEVIVTAGQNVAMGKI